MEHEIITMWVQTLSSVVGLGCIVAGLFGMKAAGHRRDREIDELAAAFSQPGEAMTKAFNQLGEVLAELLRRTP